MKLTITVRSQTTDPSSFQIEMDNGDLSPAELERLVRLWLMAATDSVSVTQQVIDEIADQVHASTDQLRDTVVQLGGQL